ncbi:MAG: M20/M25/M40 family metallo-hydrolase [Ignavibacteria bacterium]|nr:M20/M25/M40 family metallo-hydrolase [Ignavibacteria bacterium]
MLEDRLHSIVVALSRDYPSRSGLNPSVLRGSSLFLEQQLQSAGYEVLIESYRAGGLEARNLFAEKRGTDHRRPIIIVGAHYDTVIGTPGADDNASGVAGLLALAGLLKNHPNRSTIRFVLFANEEPPYFGTSQMGSMHHAAGLRKDRVNVGAMLCLEMIGYGGEEKMQSYPFPFLRQLGRYPRRGNYIALVSDVRSRRLLRRVKPAMRKGCDLGVESIVMPGFIPPLNLSDHAAFWKHGFPALMITDTAFLRNPHYHLASDTADTLNYVFLRNVVQGVYAAILALDDTD